MLAKPPMMSSTISKLPAIGFLINHVMGPFILIDRHHLNAQSGEKGVVQLGNNDLTLADT